MQEAPIFVRVYDLHGWLLDRLDGTADHGNDSAEKKAHFSELARTALDHSGKLLNAVSLAVAHFDRELRLLEADEEATLLRVHLRLACEKEVLNDRQLLYATGELTDIGRQIGGWRRHLETVE